MLSNVSPSLEACCYRREFAPYGKLENIWEKSGKSWGILKWKISGNPGYA